HLRARLWPDQFVAAGSLTFNVSELRRVLGEGQNGQRYIETVRTKGFRFVAPVKEIAVADIGVASEPEPTPAEPVRASRRLKVFAAITVAVVLASLAYVFWLTGSATPVEGPPRTVAVLPFKPLAANVRDEPLEIGICNALITRLASLEQLVVRPTSSVTAYNKMGQDPLAAGRQLHVDALLDGYIQRSQDRV